MLIKVATKTKAIVNKEKIEDADDFSEQSCPEYPG